MEMSYNSCGHCDLTAASDVTSADLLDHSTHTRTIMIVFSKDGVWIPVGAIYEISRITRVI